MFGLGPMEIGVILFIILLLFGAKKLPELARGLGKGIKEFKKASSDIKDEINNKAWKNNKLNIIVINQRHNLSHFVLKILQKL